MAGYDPNQPRDKLGQWDDVPDFGADPRLYGAKRSAPNYKRPKEDYGKPRVMFQRDPVINPSAQVGGQKLPRKIVTNEPLLHNIGPVLNPATGLKTMRTEVVTKKYADQFGNIVERPVPKTVVINRFSNISDKETTRVNRNLGRIPPGLGRSSKEWYYAQGRESLFGPPIKPAFQVIREERAQRAALMAKQRADRAQRDALVREVEAHPERAVYFKVGNNRMGVTTDPRAQKAYNAMEKTFNFMDKLTSKWWK